MKAKIFDFDNKDDNGKVPYSNEYKETCGDLESLLHKYIPELSCEMSELIASKIFAGDVKNLMAYKQGEAA